MDNEALKFLAGALALVISTASAEFTIANFVNGVRDGFHAGRAGTATGWKTFSQWFEGLHDVLRAHSKTLTTRDCERNISLIDFV
jgi:hypothetical protein